MEEAIKAKMQEHIASILCKEKIDSTDYLALEASLEEKHDDDWSVYLIVILIFAFAFFEPFSNKGGDRHES